MNYLIEYLSFFNLVHIVQFIAAALSVGTLKKFDIHFGIPERIIVFYLCFTFFTEVLGVYPLFIYSQGLETSPFYVDHPELIRAYWWYNMYSIIATACFGLYFRGKIISQLWKKITTGLIGVFIISSLTNLIFSEVYFTEFSKYTDFSSVILLVIIISVYYYEILTSDRIFKLNRSFSFLISIAVLLFYIVITPLFLLSANFNKDETLFMSFYSSLLSTANYLFYGMFIFSYLWCYWFNKSLRRR